MPKFCHNCGAPLASRGKFCSECGIPVVANAVSTEPSNHPVALSVALDDARRTRVRLGVAVAAVGVIMLGIAIAFANRSAPPEPVVIVHGPDYDKPARSTPSVSTASNSLSKAALELTIPPQQTAFTSMVESFIPSYNAADTEIRKTNLRFERKDAIVRYFSESGSLRFQGWVGQVEEMNTETDGEAAVSIKLAGSETEVKTWNNSFSDSSSHTMISRNDSLYPSLANLREGEEVTVSGTFILTDAKPDYLEEASMTEEGSMTAPEFIVKFDQIKPR